jgi:hypothetical protein
MRLSASLALEAWSFAALDIAELFDLDGRDAPALVSYGCYHFSENPVLFYC